MTHKIIQTENYLLVVSDEEIEIKVGEYFLLENRFVNKWNGESTRATTSRAKKIIAHKPLNGAPYLDGVDELPELDESVEVSRLADELHENYPDWAPAVEHYDYTRGIIDGYNKAKEKFAYTEDDLRKAISETRKGMLYNKKYEDEYIQSLNQPKLPVAFEQGISVVTGHNGMHNVFGTQMSITNSEGRVQWCGTYKF